MKYKLDQKPSKTRLQSLATTSRPSDKADRSGGIHSAGILENVSAISRGEALGHEMWIDQAFLAQVASALEQAGNGSKCRFTHPGLSADGLSKALGVAIGGRVDGDKVLTTIHFYGSAHKTPDGDLAGYVMDRADEDPEKFGLSIVFTSDFEAEKQFLLDNGGEIVVHDDGWDTWESVEGFTSPDPLNTGNLPHCRLAEFHAVDVVDDPAANPDGLFHRDLSVIDAANPFLDYVLGLSEKKPADSTPFGVDADRAKLFLQRFFHQRHLRIETMKKGKLAAAADPAMAPETVPPADQAPADAPVETPEGSVTCPECGAVFVPESEPQPIGENPQSPTDYAAAHKQYVDAFGTENGTKWFLGNIRFSDAQRMHFTAQIEAKDKEIARLSAKLNDAETRLAAIANSGEKPLAASAPPAGTENQPAKAGLESVFRIAGKN